MEQEFISENISAKLKKGIAKNFKDQEYEFTHYTAQVQLPRIWPLLNIDRQRVLSIGIAGKKEVKELYKVINELKDHLEEVLEAIE